MDEALYFIRDKLEQDTMLEERTALSIELILELLNLGLKTTYFSYGDKFYQQNDGAAMGSPLSPVVANLYTEKFELEALESAPTKPDLWLRFVDDTFNLWPHSKSELNPFLAHLNSQQSSIQITMETEDEGKLPFLDVMGRRM